MFSEFKVEKKKDQAAFLIALKRHQAASILSVLFLMLILCHFIADLKKRTTAVRSDLLTTQDTGG